MTDRTPDLLDLLDLAGRPVDRPKGLRLGWRNTHPDLRSRDGYRWAWPGNWSEAPDDGRDLTKNHRDEACPSYTLGGLCLAKTWGGARSGGIRSSACLIVAYRSSDVLGDAADKLRVRRAITLDVIDVEALIRSADLDGADLAGAYLAGANLSGANLSGANLTRADLTGADLAGANLSGADLTGADLTRAYLAGANLTGADLTRAYLAGANLAGANLTRANLTRADLTRVNLSGVYLSGANLTGADLRWTRLPDGYRVDDTGLIVATS